MTDPFLSNNNNQNSEIIIQDQEKQQYYQDELPIEETIGQEEQFNPHKRIQQIKINRDKLLKYAALTEKNPNIYHLSSNSAFTKNDEQSMMMKTTKLNKTPSNPLIKPIKHKVTSQNMRLKTNSDKQNNFQPILPKMNDKKSTSRHFLNKTTSAITFKTHNDKNKCLELKDISSTKFTSRNIQTQSKIQVKSSQKKLKITQSRSKQQKRSINKTPSLSKFRYINQMQSTYEISVDHTQVMNALQGINQKQQTLMINKKILEQKIKQLKDGIQKQQNSLNEIGRNRQKIVSFMSRQEHISKHSLDGVKLFRKKMQNCQFQSKNIQTKIEQMSQSNTKITQAINQQKQLITMYQSVIQQLRVQLKVQKQTKLDLQKKLTIMKKNMKTSQTKLESQQNNTRQLFQKIFVSLDRWQ